MRICEYCGGEVSDTARKCKHCGEWLKKEIEQPKTVLKETKTCEYCGGKVANTAKKCKHCGEWITEQGTQQSLNKSTKIKVNPNISNDIGSIIENYINTTELKSNILLVKENLTEEVIVKSGMTFDKGEKPLLLLFKKFLFIDGPCKTRLLITNKKVYFKVYKAEYRTNFTIGWEKPMECNIEIKGLKNFKIGEEIEGYNNYLGHQIFINNELIGLIRFSGYLLCDDNAIEYLNNLFNELINKMITTINENIQTCPINITKPFKEYGVIGKIFLGVFEILAKVVSIFK